jgi:hypothetical protein
MGRVFCSPEGDKLPSPTGEGRPRGAAHWADATPLYV